MEPTPIQPKIVTPGAVPKNEDEQQTVPVKTETAPATPPEPPKPQVDPTHLDDQEASTEEAVQNQNTSKINLLAHEDPSPETPTLPQVPDAHDAVVAEHPETHEHKHNRVVPIVVALVVVLMLGGGGGAYWFMNRQTADEVSTTPPATTHEEPKQETPAATPAPEPTPAPAPEPQTVTAPTTAPTADKPQTVTIKSPNGMWLRSTPDSSSRANIITWMPNNAQISVDSTGDFWWHGTYNGKSGYFASKYTQ